MKDSTGERTVSVRLESGLSRTFDAVWLRDNCRCLACRHPRGQRILDTAQIPGDLGVLQSTLDQNLLVVVFSDGHRSCFDLARLEGHLSEERPPPRARHLWGAELTDELPRSSWPEVGSDDAVLAHLLSDIDRLGFAYLADCGTRPGTLRNVVSCFGHIRVTNYGEIFDVNAVVDPSNLANSALGLAPHTDNPYRDPEPTLQLLHCLSSSAVGGESLVVDGFAVAAALRERSPESYELLTSERISFRYADDDTDLETMVPVLSLDLAGELVTIRYNTRSAQPFTLPGHVMAPYYDAYRLFGQMLVDPEFVVSFALSPGDAFVLDNRRVLHGRRAFSPSGGERLLQGCYADRDSLRSRLAVLTR